MDARKDRIGEHLAEHPSSWIVRAIGPVPEHPLDRLDWQRRAADIGAYRELYNYDHPDEPIGPEPTGDSPDKRAAWQAAFAALGPADGTDLQTCPTENCSTCARPTKPKPPGHLGTSAVNSGKSA